MTLRTVTVTDSDATVNVANRDSLEVTFTQTAYPLSVSNVTNCTVTPTTIANTTNLFTATFATDFVGSYSFKITNSAPEVPDGIFTDLQSAAGQQVNQADLQATNWALLRETTDGVSYEEITTTTSLPWNNSGGAPASAVSNTDAANSGSTNNAFAIINNSGNLQFDSSVFYPSFFNINKRTINIIAYSATFTLTAGEYVRTHRLQGTNAMSSAWMFNQTTGTYTQMTDDSSVTHANAVKAPANGTYRVVVFSGVQAFASQNGARTGRSEWDDFIAHDANGNRKRTITISGVVSRSPVELIENSQVQETGDALVHLFELKLPAPRSTTLFMHDGLNFDSGTGKNIYFPTKDGSATNEYIAFPISIEGLQTKSGGGSNKPTLAMANIPVLSRTLTNNTDGTDDETNLEQIFTDEGMNSAEGFLGGSITYRSTLLKYTFDSASAVTGSLPIEYPSYVYTLDRVSREESALIQFELATPADLDNITLPNRRAVGKYCSWEYQGALYKRGGCTVPANVFGAFFDEDDKLITANINATSGAYAIAAWDSNTAYSAGARVRKVFSGAAGGHRIYEAIIATPAGKNPEINSIFWKRLDVCGKRIKSCKMRFHTVVSAISGDPSLANTILTDPTHFNSSKALPFGGFPGSKKFK